MEHSAWILLHHLNEGYQLQLVLRTLLQQQTAGYAVVGACHLLPDICSHKYLHDSHFTRIFYIRIIAPSSPSQAKKECSCPGERLQTALQNRLQPYVQRYLHQ